MLGSSLTVTSEDGCLCGQSPRTSVLWVGPQLVFTFKSESEAFQPTALPGPVRAPRP